MSAEVKGYEELAPPAALADAVDAFWRFTASGPAPGQHRVLPDGCTDLIFHFRNTGGRAWLAEPRLVAVGPMERFALVDLEPGAVSVGVRLKPGWALPLLGVSPRELYGLSVPVADCAPPLAALQRRLEDCRSPGHLMGLLQRTVVERWARLSHPPRAADALRWLQASGGQVRLSTLARELGRSERTLHRQVLDEAGVAPKLLARVLRFQRAVGLLRSGSPVSAVALECGYSDQAHLTRETREFSGLTPSALRG